MVGIVTDSTAAATRQDAVKEANDLIGDCHEAETGTDPYVIEGDITVHCFMENGGLISCSSETASDWGGMRRDEAGADG